MRLHSAQHEPRPGEAGYLLAAAVVMTAILLISISVAAPVIARDIRREKEVESMHRSQQYVRAIRLYYRKFKNYPPSLEALEKSNNIRFLRKQYDDPLTGKPDWRIIHVGENQTTVKGFFGEPLGGISSTGVGGGGLGSASGMSSGIGTSGTSIDTGCSAATSAFCDQKKTTSNSGSGTGTGTGLGSSSGGVGQIMGVATARSGNSMLTPNQQETYDTWEFLYDPRIEQMYAKSNILGGGIGSQSAAGFGSDATSGKNNTGTGTNSLGNGSTSGFGSTTTTPTTTPQ